MTSSKSIIMIYAGPSCYCILVVTKVGSLLTATLTDMHTNTWHMCMSVLQTNYHDNRLVQEVRDKFGESQYY